MKTASASFCWVALSITLVLLTAAPVSADTYVLQPDGSGDFPSLQFAVSGALDGDIIELASGTYDTLGNCEVAFQGKALTIRGQTGDPADVVIDCQGSIPRRAFLFISGEGPGSVLQDLTIRNARTVGHGAAVYCEFASPIIDGCVFDSNIADGSESYGGGIYCIGESSPTITGCSFTGNKASEFANGRGGAIACRNGANATISDCYFVNNEAEYRGGAIYFDQCDATIADCIVENNEADSGAGIYVRYGVHEVAGCLVLSNQTWDGRGGGLLADTGGELDITDCTFFGNRANTGGAMYVNSHPFILTKTIVASSTAGGGVWYAYDPYRDATVSCCNVWNNEGGNYSHIIGDQTGINDNISVDPQFCDEAESDFRLFDTSPCSPVLSPCGLQIGAYGAACDSPVEPSSWGRIKATYR